MSSRAVRGGQTTRQRLLGSRALPGVLALLLVLAATPLYASEARVVKSLEQTPLEKQVDELCATLTQGIVPDTLHLTWFDSRHPQAPLLCDAFVASMVERCLLRRGFQLATRPDEAFYVLQLTLTPCQDRLLTLAQLKSGERVIASGEGVFSTVLAPWNEGLTSHRYRTRTRIPIGGAP